MKKRYALIWSKVGMEWICVDITRKPEGMETRKYLYESSHMIGNETFRYIGV